MVIDNPKITRAAEKFIERFGTAAPFEAGRRVEELRRAGNPQSAATWSAIRDVIETLIDAGAEDG